MKDEFVFPENGEGLRLARDRCFKMWKKEQQRNLGLRKENEKLRLRIDEIIWGQHIDENVVGCSCGHCKRYTSWLERKS